MFEINQVKMGISDLAGKLSLVYQNFIIMGKLIIIVALMIIVVLKKVKSYYL